MGVHLHGDLNVLGPGAAAKPSREAQRALGSCVCPQHEAGQDSWPSVLLLIPSDRCSTASALITKKNKNKRTLIAKRG